jgi:hypothetical protein
VAQYTFVRAGGLLTKIERAGRLLSVSSVMAMPESISMRFLLASRLKPQPCTTEMNGSSSMRPPFGSLPEPASWTLHHRYLPELVGKHSIVVSVLGTPISSVPFVADVLGPDPASTTAHGPGLREVSPTGAHPWPTVAFLAS